MRKFLLMASALMILGGCTIDNIEIENKKGNPPGEQIRITANYASANQDESLKAVSTDDNGPSRVSYNDPFDPSSSHQRPEDHPAIEVTWAQNDKILIHDFTQQGASAEFNLQSGQGTKVGEFTGSNPQQAEGNQLKAIYPVKDYHSYWDYIEMSVIGQVQNGNKNMDHISQYDYMIGDVVLTDNSTGNKSAQVSFKRQIALMKFVLTLPADIGTPEQIVMSTANQSIVTIQEIGRGATKASLLALGLSNITVTEGQPIIAYLAALPFTLTNEDLAIKVIGSQKHYQFTAANVTKSYLAGEQYVAVLDATDFTDVTPTGPVALSAPEPADKIVGRWAQIGGLKVSREGTEETGIKVSKANMVSGAVDLTNEIPIELIGGDIVELLANNNESGEQPGGYGAFWIDWNRDGILDNDTEAIMFPRNGTTPIAAPTLAAGAENIVMYSSATVGTFTVPDDKPDGTYYGRVMRDYQAIVNAHTATESVTYIDFAIEYKQMNVIPEGDPVATIVIPAKTDINIFEDKATVPFTIKLNKKVETDIPLEITLDATHGTLENNTITINKGEKQATGNLVFNKADFNTTATNVTLQISTVTGGVKGTPDKITYSVKVLENTLEYFFLDNTQTRVTTLKVSSFYTLGFETTAAGTTIPDGTQITFDVTNGIGGWIDIGQGWQAFPDSVNPLTISQDSRFQISIVQGTGTIKITCSTMPAIPLEGFTVVEAQ